MATSPSLLGTAVLRGLVTAEDVHAGVVRVRTLFRSNPVHVVERRGEPVGFVKQAGRAARLDGDDVVAARLDGDDVVATETQVLRAVAALDLTPSLVPQGGSGAVWLRPVPGVELAKVDDPQLLVAAAHELGAGLARLHRHRPRSWVPAAPRPWPLLRDLPPSMALGEHQPQTAAVIEATRSPEIDDALDVARAAWGPAHVVHGDVSATNVLADVRGDVVAIHLVDLELGGLGQPDHDLACAAAMLADLAPQGDLVTPFVQGYAGAGGPGQVRPEWQLVRVLLTAWQHAATFGDEAAGEVRRLLARARELATEVTP